MRFPKTLLLLMSVLILAFSACEDDEPSTGDDVAGDTAVDSSEGDATADTTEGDTAEGDTAEGDTTAGDTSEGDTTAGDTSEGDTTAGDTTTGDTAEDVVETCSADIVGVPDSGNSAAVYGDIEGLGRFVQFITRDEGTPFARLSYEWYFDFEATKGARTFSYETIASECATCVLGFTGCTDSDGVVCEKTFVISSGTLEVTTMDIAYEPYGDSQSLLQASLRDAIFVEAELNPNTYEATPVENGETWCIDEHIIDIVITEYTP